MVLPDSDRRGGSEGYGIPDISLSELIEKFRPFPENTAILGIAEDGFPLCWDLGDPDKAERLLVIGSENGLELLAKTIESSATTLGGDVFRADEMGRIMILHVGENRRSLRLEARGYIPTESDRQEFRIVEEIGQSGQAATGSCPVFRYSGNNLLFKVPSEG